MEQAVEDNGDQNVVVEDPTPIWETLVGGNDQADPLVAAYYNEAEEQTGFCASEW